MLKRSVTYTNPFTDQEVTEDHYFHISKADLVKMQMENANENPITDESGEKLEGYRAKLMRIIQSENGKDLIDAIEELIQRAYGKKDGDRFLKSKAIWDDFAASEAYSQLFFELCTDSEKASDFMIGIIPGDLDSEAAKLALEKIQADQNGDAPAEPVDNVDQKELRVQEISEATPDAPVTLTRLEATEMSGDVLTNGLRDGRYKLS